MDPDDNEDYDNRTNNQNNISADDRKNPGTGDYENDDTEEPEEEDSS